MLDSEYRHMYREEEAHWWYAGMRALMGALLSTESLPASPRILDAGCGTGFNLGWLGTRHGDGVTGIDSSASGLGFCRDRGARDLVRADVSMLPFRPGAFDLITAFDLLSELRDDRERVLTLDEFFRSLKPGGRLLVRVPAYEWLRSSHDAGVSTRRRFGRGELIAAVSRAGFQTVRATYANTILFPLAAVWRLGKKAGLAPSGSDVRPATRGTSLGNRLLLRILQAEAAILRGRGFRFPFGLSILLLAARPAAGHAPNISAASPASRIAKT